MTDECGVIQVTNVAPTATTEQMQTLFGFIGKVQEVVLYPDGESAFASKMCYVKFADPDDVCVALHLSNTVFIDRAIVVSAVLDGMIPDEETALKNHPDVNVSRAGGGSSGIASADISKVDEIKRTIYVSNLDHSITPEFLMQLFGTKAGEVKYVRMAGDEGLTTRAAFIEFTHQTSVMLALSLTGQTVLCHPIRVVPATTSIVKPVTGLMGATSKELEEALKKVSEAEPLIAAVVDPDSRHSRSRSRRRSKSPKRRSKSRSRSRRSRSRRRSRSKSPRRKSRSPRRRRSKSRSPRRRSGSRSRHARKRSRSRTPKLGSRSHRSRSRDRSKREDAKPRGSPKHDRSSARERSDKDEKANKESSRSRPDTARRRSRSPGRRSGVKRSRSKSKSPRRDKEKDRNQNSSRDRGSRDLGKDRDRDRERDRDRDRVKDKDRDRGRDREQTRSRDSKRERREDRDGDHEEIREKDEEKSESTSKRSRYEKAEQDDPESSPARTDVERETKTLSDSEMNLSDS